MAAGAQATQAAVRVLPAVEKPYAVLLLPAVLSATPPRKQELFLPLTLAYLLSAHIPFQFPIREHALPLVERVFDDILHGLPKESKGICYQSVDGEQRASALVPPSLLLLTDDRGLEELGGRDGLPVAVLSKSEGNTNLLRLRHLEKIGDLGLRGKLAGCAQLINVQSGGFITEGHFSLSW
jgi:hypothetical protein